MKEKEEGYNQSFGKYKLLSSTAGVGSIIPTKWGGFIMPLSISEWEFVKAATEKINKNNGKITDNPSENGFEIVNDERFIDFLKQKKQMPSLRCFVAIPHAELDIFNEINIKDHPLNNMLSHSLRENMLYIPAINFPRWFISSKSELKTYDEWLEIWEKNKCNDGKKKYFAPPRDPYKKIGREQYRNLKDKTKYGLLKPVTMVLICPNGHISDIPWYEYFCAKLEKVDMSKPYDLFHHNCKPCSKTGERHNLKWIDNPNQSESWGRLICKDCKEYVSLEGIMNIKPYCIGERPWILGKASEECKTNGQPTIMRTALVTSNSIYYANCLNSLYIPEKYFEGLQGQMSPDAKKCFDKVQEIYNKKKEKGKIISRGDFWKMRYGDTNEKLIEEVEEWCDINLNDIDCDAIKQAFLNLENIVEIDDEDIQVSYRYFEYKVFANNTSTLSDESSLNFEDIELPATLSKYFSKIQKVDTLAITTIQLGFSRVTMPSPSIENNIVVYHDEQIKPIYTESPKNIVVLPANQLFGEGIFFMFDEEKVNEWSNKQINDCKLEDHYACKLSEDDLGKFTYEKISKYGKARFYLLHTFAHIIIKELEFTCGYPSASLSERLYYSDKMCGVLIYTADGAEGSMGGLVWQGEPKLIEKIIRTAMDRAFDCSSDPLCWENEDGLNRAACFSCCMISETSCEERNLGLDRRALVDSEYGFFKDLILKT